MMRIAIFGLGSIGKRHAENLISMGETNLRAYDPSIIEGCPVFIYMQDIGKWMERRANEKDIWEWGPEVVLVCAPPKEHYTIAFEAMSRSAHVFVEKPLAAYSWEASALVNRAMHSGYNLAVGYQLRWQLKDFLGGAAGENTKWICGQDMSMWSSRYEKDVLEEFSHEIDAAVFVNGPVESVVGFKSSTGAWRLHLKHLACTSEIFLDPHTNGYIRTADSRTHHWQFDEKKNEQAYKDELRAFLDLCAGKPGTDYLCNGQEAAHVCQIIEACRESQRWCKVVKL